MPACEREREVFAIGRAGAVADIEERPGGSQKGRKRRGQFVLRVEAGIESGGTLADLSDSIGNVAGCVLDEQTLNIQGNLDEDHSGAAGESLGDGVHQRFSKVFRGKADKQLDAGGDEFPGLDLLNSVGSGAKSVDVGGLDLAGENNHWSRIAVSGDERSDGV